MLFAVTTCYIKIDKIIDAGREHDVGRPPDPNSFRKLLQELWLEFGDTYIT